MRTIPIVILMFVAVPAAAASQKPGAPVADPSLLAAPPADEGGSEADLGIAEDPHADRGVLLPTALTQPAGTVSISSYEVLFAGLTFGITDRLQVSTTALLGPILGVQIFLGNLKWQVLRQGSLRLSVNAGASYVRAEDDEGFHRPDGEATVSHRVSPHLGAALSHCLTDDCQSLLTASVQILTNPNGYRLGQSSAVYGASLISRLSEHTKLVVEVSSQLELYPSLAQSGGALPTAALRYFRRYVAFDGGVMGLAESGGDFIPLPYFAGSFRF